MPADVQRALDDAERLASTGAHLAAIRLLSEANRRLGDPAIARRLVELRFAGAKRLMSTDGVADLTPAALPPWPDEVVDDFPGAKVPEVEAGSLDVETLRSAIENHGSLLVRGLVDPTTTQRLAGDIDRTFAAYDAFGGRGPTGAVAEDESQLGWFERCPLDPRSDRSTKRERGAVLAVDSPLALANLVDVLDDVDITALVEEYFGERPMLLAKKVTLRRVSHDANTGGWHQDGAFMGPGIRSLNLWIALDHCGDTAPGIDVVGRRLDGLVRSEGEAFAAWGVTPNAAAAVAGDDLVRPVFEAGDALLFDQLFLHRTAVDPGMNHDRRAIETWFLSPSTYGEMVDEVAEGYQPRDQLPILL